MRTIIFIILLCCIYATPSKADILIYYPDGKYVKKPTLTAALNTVDVAGKTIVVTSAININNVTIPTNVTLRCENEGVITINSGQILTINGAFQAGMNQVFKGPGVVKFQDSITAYIYPKWWGAVGDGVNDDTNAIQSTIDVAANSNIKAVVFTPGIYTVNAPSTEPGTRSYSAAIVINGLKNCTIKGTGNVTIKAGTGGAGAADFALFRVQASKNIEICDFKFDGDATAKHFRDGGSRSGGIYITSFNVINPSIDLDDTKGVHIHHIECNDMGGFVKVVKRNETAYPRQRSIYDLIIEDCYGTDAALKDNCIGLNYTIGIKVRNNRFRNTPRSNPYPSLFVDISRGCENATVENNIGSNFYYGMKSESTNILTTNGYEYRLSKNVSFINNELSQIGHPTTYSPGGPSGGESFGIKAKSINVQVIGNRISGINGINVTHGLSTGIYLPEITGNEITNIVKNNIISRCKNGITHSNVKTDPSIKNASTIIENNEIRSTTSCGIIAQGRALVQYNKLYDTGSYAISVQIADRTIIKNNYAHNCGASVTGVVYYQEEKRLAGYFEFLDNDIVDTRGSNAAAYGYSFAVGNSDTSYSNNYKFRSGSTIGISKVSHL